MRLRRGNTWGSGVWVAPRVVLTAAHVVSDAPGRPLAQPCELMVTPMFGPLTQVEAQALCTTPEWKDGAPDAWLHDLAVISTDRPAPTHLLPHLDFGAVATPFTGAAYGFVGDLSVRGLFREGNVTHDGVAIQSSDLALSEGMSGGPILAQLSTEDLGPSASEHVLIGICRCRPAIEATRTNVGLLLRKTAFQSLLRALSTS